MVDLVNWDPYRDVRGTLDRFARMFQGGGTARRDREEDLSMGAWMPPVDIVEEKERIVLAVELPGFDQNDVQLHMEGNTLTVRGERKFENEKEGRNYHRVERAYGQFIRSFTLPNNVDREGIRASFRNGVLEIELPKREEAKPRQIRIGGGDVQAQASQVQGTTSSGSSSPGARPRDREREPVEVQPR